MELMLTAKALSKRDDVFMPYSLILASCRKAVHPLPHIETGSGNNKKYYIRPSAFEQWCQEEEQLSVRR